MQYALSEEQVMLKEMAARMAREELAPRAAAVDAEARFPTHAWELFKQAGLLGCDFPTAYGGAGMGVLALCLATEEIAGACASSATVLLCQELGAMPILLAGSEEQKKAWLPGLASGEHLISFGLTEPNAGSDVAGVATRAEKRGDKYILNGVKQFISHADQAQYICVACVTDPKRPAHNGGLSIIVVEKGAPGLGIGRKEDKMGLRGSSTCQVLLEDCEVPAGNILGSPGDGFAILMKTLDFTRPCVGAQAVGIGQGALDFAVGYAKERRQFGQPIIKLQGLSWILADMDAKLEAARQVVYRAAAAFEKVPKDLGRVPQEAVRLSAISKLVGSEAAMAVTTDAVQVLGGYGYTKEYPVERMMRDAKITQIYEGTSQVQKVVIASCL